MRIGMARGNLLILAQILVDNVSGNARASAFHPSEWTEMPLRANH
jgi:hypothetical protein